jgi:type VII secretion integral membrane protein EccD
VLGPRVGAAVAACTAALFVLLLAGHHRGLFLAVLLVGGAGLVATALTLLGLTDVQAATAVVVAALLASLFAPSLAFRLALLRLPQLPTGAADLSEDIEPYPAPRLISGAAVADTYLTWVLAAVGVICTAGIVTLVRAGGWLALCLALAVVGVFALRARSLTSGWQRGATLLPAVVGAALLVVDVAETGMGILGAATALAALAIGMVALARSLPGRRLLPHWGRVADIGEYVVAIGLIVLALHAFGVYEWARALSG